MIYEIKSGDLVVKISDLGAEVQSVIYKGKERVWQNENGKWAKHSPVLFPVCGNNAVVIGGKDYNMPFHGFASTSVFTAERVNNYSVTFVLSYSEDTLKVYPYLFRLSITYTVCGNTLLIKNAVENLGKADMPFALARHDSFALDTAIDDYKLCFDESEEFLSQETDYTARLINLYADFGCGKDFILPADYLAEGRTVIFGKTKSRAVSLKTLDNGLIARLLYPDVDNILLWRPDGADMICIEAWSALPDISGETVGFTENEKFFRLSSGGRKTVDFQIEYY